MSIKKILQGWLGVSSADSVCEQCGDVGAGSVRAFQSLTDSILCQKCMIIDKYKKVCHVKYKADKNKIRQAMRDKEYTQAQEYFNSRDEKT